jgi:Ulp1 family protease
LGDTYSGIILPSIEKWLREEAIGKERTALEELSHGERFFHEVVLDVPMQDNCVDCGVYFCMNMFSVLFGQDYICNPVTANKCRELIGADILRGRIKCLP